MRHSTNLVDAVSNAPALRARQSQPQPEERGRRRSRGASLEATPISGRSSLDSSTDSGVLPRPHLHPSSAARAPRAGPLRKRVRELRRLSRDATEDAANARQRYGEDSLEAQSTTAASAILTGARETAEQELRRAEGFGDDEDTESVSFA